MKNKKVPAVYIKFKDHCSESKWINKVELDNFKYVYVYQVGWLVGETDDVYKVSGQACENGEYGDTIAILKSTVEEIKRIKL